MFMPCIGVVMKRLWSLWCTIFNFLAATFFIAIGRLFIVVILRCVFVVVLLVFYEHAARYHSVMAHAGLVIMLSARAGLPWQIMGMKWAGGNQLVRIFTNFKLLSTPLMTCTMKKIAMSLYLLCMKNGNSWRGWAGRETALIKNKQLWLTWKFAYEAKKKNAFRSTWLHWGAYWTKKPC